ncbi:hypothetical protein WMY93_019646 [Mugilogobius chulae]|uniref:K Homology domain-containing protein n=1 Tax=Mugilogobius chulae TaxID=88201 RepID=A0AAW0NG70_9GOBI
MGSENYLPELMAEKDTLDPTFQHSLRLLDQEIEKIQKDEGKEEEKERFIDVVINKNMKLGQKVLIPVKQFPKFNFVGKLLGPRGNSLKRLQEDTLTKMSILGKGSMRDKEKEEELRQKWVMRWRRSRNSLYQTTTMRSDKPAARTHIPERRLGRRQGTGSKGQVSRPCKRDTCSGSPQHSREPTLIRPLRRPNRTTNKILYWPLDDAESFVYKSKKAHTTAYCLFCVFGKESPNLSSVLGEVEEVFRPRMPPCPEEQRPEEPSPGGPEECREPEVPPSRWIQASSGAGSSGHIYSEVAIVMRGGHTEGLLDQLFPIIVAVVNPFPPTPAPVFVGAQGNRAPPASAT